MPQKCRGRLQRTQRLTQLVAHHLIETGQSFRLILDGGGVSLHERIDGGLGQERDGVIDALHRAENVHQVRLQPKACRFLADEALQDAAQ